VLSSNLGVWSKNYRPLEVKKSNNVCEFYMKKCRGRRFTGRKSLLKEERIV
jgi:hypothetical protein